MIKYTTSPELSIIIPAYNEERRISQTLEKVLDFADDCRYDTEIIVVDDGSHDHTSEMVIGFCKGERNIRLVKNEHNRGKGYSVKRGMLEAKGNYRLFTDADLSVPIEQAEDLLQALREGFDIAIGVRGGVEGKVYVPQPIYRAMGGKIFSFLSRQITSIKSADSQCGFKCYKDGAASVIFSRQRIDGFAFDVEDLYLAQKYGYRIREVPVDWVNKPHSSVKVYRDSPKMLAEILAIRLNDLKGVYNLKQVHHAITK